MPLLIFPSSCFFILFWLDVCFFLLVYTVDLSPSFLRLTIGSLYIFLCFSWHRLHFFIWFLNRFNQFCERPNYQCFELCISDRLAISSSLSCIVSGALKCSVIWAIFYFFLSWHACYFKGRSLRCSPGRGNTGCCAVMLYVGEGLRGSSGIRSPLHRVSATPSACLLYTSDAADEDSPV